MLLSDRVTSLILNTLVQTKFLSQFPETEIPKTVATL